MYKVKSISNFNLLICFFMILIILVHFQSQSFKIFNHFLLQFNNFLWFRILNFLVDHLDIFSNLINRIVNLLLSEFSKVVFKLTYLISHIPFDSFWKSRKLLKFLRFTTFRRLLNCQNSEFIFIAEKVLDLEN